MTNYLNFLNNDTVSVDEKRIAKWQVYGFPLSFYYKNPDFTDFLFESRLLSQMKITKINELRPVKDDLKMMVEGHWMKGHEILKQFEIREDPTHHETFIFRKKTNQVYTYVDTNQGLIPFHPYHEGLKTPISLISPEDYLKFLKNAHKFVRENEQDLSKKDKIKKNQTRTCILQIVTSRLNEETPHYFLTKNAYHLIDCKHNWLRLIEPASIGAKVYGISYGWETRPHKSLEIVKGRFFSIDPWEYRASKKIVTSIAISVEELKKLKAFLKKYVNHQTPTGFNILGQNCTFAVKVWVKKAIGIHIPTEISFTQLIKKIMPDIFNDLIRQMNKIMNSFIQIIKAKWLKKIWNKINKKLKTLQQAAIALSLTLLSFLLGATTRFKQQEFLLFSPQNQTFQTLFTKKYLYQLQQHQYHLPFVIENWQKQQASTVTYHKNHRGFNSIST